MATQSGGYFAIKGFTYQFDKSILEVLANQGRDVEIEQIQDIGINNYYIQVKYKETQNYADSKIKPAIIQLIDCFIKDKTKSFALYCYFKDKSSQKAVLTEEQLDKILASAKDSYTSDDKKSFSEHFSLEFSENFAKQFTKVIAEIKSSFTLRNEEEATVYHSIFRANLLEVATRRNPRKRIINFRGLKILVGKKEKIIFELAYCKYLKNERYLKYLKKEYFTFNKVNIPNKERFFVLEIDMIAKDSEILQVISSIKGRYFKKHSSPAPYICLLNIKNDRLTSLKQKLWDKELTFVDGTHFNGDRFRITDLVRNTHDNNSDATFKLLLEENIPSFLKKKKIDETFIFLTSGDSGQRFSLTEFKEFYINHTKDIIKIIQ